MSELSPVDFFFVTVAAVIFGSALTGVAIMAVTRYSRAEQSGWETKWYDLFLALIAFAFVFYGMWRGGLFG